MVTVGARPIAAGARWSLIGLASKQILRIGFTLLLARLLGPENFGIVGQATIYLALSTVFLDLGVGAALIQRETVSRSDEATAAALNLLVAAALVALTFAVAPAIARFFATPELTTVLRVLSLSFVLVGFTVVPSALLTRELDFRRLGIAEVSSTVAGGIAGVSAAFAGAEYWALVVQTLVRDGVHVIMLTALRGLPVIGWASESWHRIAGFSRNVLGAQLLGYTKSNADNTLIGRFLGASDLALYALSYRVLMLPVQILAQTMTRLIFPVLSRLHDDRQVAYDTFLRATRTLSLAVIPLMVLVALNAPRAVPWAFGADWEAAIVPLQILAIASIMRAIGPLVGALVLAAGRARLAFRWELVSTSVTIASFAIGLRWGIDGVAWSYLVSGIPLQVIYLFIVNRHEPFGLVRYLATLVPAGLGAVGLIAAWLVTNALIGTSLGPFLSLLVLTLAAGCGYFAVLALTSPAALSEQYHFVRLMANRSSA